MIILSVEEVAEILRVPDHTIRYLMDEKGLPFIRLGERIRVVGKTDLEAWVESRREVLTRENGE